MGRQLASYDNTTYTYNESGIRTSKTVGEDTTEFYLNGTNVIYQTDGTNDIYFFYDRNDEIVGFKYNGNNYFYVKNAMGDITDIADSSGVVVASYTYDPWGSVLSVTGSNAEIGNLNPFRYRSYYYDSDIQMYYLQSRYYDPEVGRFINCDDVNYIGLTESSGSYNPFAYCENNPVDGWDPEGNVGYTQNLLSTIYLIYNWLIFNQFSKKIRSGYIYDQRDFFGSDMIYGGYRLRYNGCEVIAAYNVLKYLGKFKPIYSVIRHAELNDWYLFPVVPTGVFGTSPRKLKQIFDENGLRFKTFVNTKSKEFASQVKNGKICIATFSNKPYTKWKVYENLMIHTFAFYYDNKRKSFYTFNGYSTNNDRTFKYSDYSALRESGRYFLYGYIFY